MLQTSLLCIRKKITGDMCNVTCMGQVGSRAGILLLKQESVRTRRKEHKRARIKVARECNRQGEHDRWMHQPLCLLALIDAACLSSICLLHSNEQASPRRPAVICKYYYYTCALEDAYCGFACTIIILVREG
jgi:hypothetical protein